MLAGAGLGDDALLAHAAGQQDLAHAVVRLVRAGVVQFVALEVDFRPAQFFGEAAGEPEWAGSPDIVRQVIRQIGMERGVGLRLVISLLDREDQRHQGLGDEPAAIIAEAATLVWTVTQSVGDGRAHAIGSPEFSCRVIRAEWPRGKAPRAGSVSAD